MNWQAGTGFFFFSKLKNLHACEKPMHFFSLGLTSVLQQVEMNGHHGQHNAQGRMLNASNHGAHQLTIKIAYGTFDSICATGCHLLALAAVSLEFEKLDGRLRDVSTAAMPRPCQKRTIGIPSTNT